MRLHIQIGCDAFINRTSGDAFVESERIRTLDNVAFWAGSNASGSIA
jgi:hypothetical protein